MKTLSLYTSYYIQSQKPAHSFKKRTVPVYKLTDPWQFLFPVQENEGIQTRNEAEKYFFNIMDLFYLYRHVDCWAIPPTSNSDGIYNNRNGKKG